MYLLYLVDKIIIFKYIFDDISLRLHSALDSKNIENQWLTAVMFLEVVSGL